MAGSGGETSVSLALIGLVYLRSLSGLYQVTSDYHTLWPRLDETIEKIITSCGGGQMLAVWVYWNYAADGGAEK